MRKTSTLTSVLVSGAIALGTLFAIGVLSSSAVSATLPPTVTTGDSTQVRPTAVRVHGVVNPQGQETHYMIEYGQTTSYGLQTAPASAGSSTGNVAVQQTLGDLQPNTTYHYRVVATNTAGTTNGDDNSFTVSQPQSTVTQPQPTQPANSRVAFLGHMGFVSSSHMTGLAASCFGGAAACTGHITVRVARNHRVIASRGFSIRPNSGGFQNVRISRYGASLLTRHGFRLLRVNLQVSSSTGQAISRFMTLARWVGH